MADERFLSSRTMAAWIMGLPAVVIYATLFVLPLLIMFTFSLKVVDNFKVTDVWTLDNYREAFANPVYLNVAARTVFTAFLTTISSLLVGYPLAYFVSKIARSRILLLLIVIPFWTSFVVRAYAWAVILGPRGVINQLLLSLGLVDEPIRELLYGPISMGIGLLCLYLPFMILSIYVALERLDDRLLEAGRDLYASPWTIWRRVTLPMTMPGVITGCIFVFIPVTGEYVVPVILGGVNSYLSANIVVNLFGQSGQWGIGSAIAFTMMAFILVMLFLLRLLARVWRIAT
ncbi:ABC transporter permease [Mesorhizobium sp. M3A.F.Ca.ET.201.01.1.1]|uniref:ABC transporter permease n=1 Tax=Mesorhizobium sp. M3A.F.Ca.ET.201.01.1.1 TaxID=2563946 RepID=UPI00167209AD|nr:ABC transporter permease [Mesorhizobium sp. M3A.F.Ca.ET.201.01.1.1]